MFKVVPMQDSMTLTSKQRRVLITFVVLIITMGTIDIATDLSEGADVTHLLIEGVGICLGVTFIFWILKQNRQIAIQEEHLSTQLKQANADATAWKSSNQELVQGLSRAIDEQFQNSIQGCT